MTLGDAVAVLERTPRALDGMLRGHSDDWARTTTGPGVWSPLEILAHLINGEATDWIPRARIILEHGESRAFDPFDREGMFSLLKDRSLDDLLDEFATRRSHNLKVLADLSVGETWGARGLHPDLGPVTFGQLISTWATHDLAHIAQIAEVMAKRNREPTGPWRAYLPILDRPDLEGD